jgi:hypothetical protein
METRVINTREEYNAAAKRLEELVFSENRNELEEEIDMLTAMIETYDHAQNT